MMGQSLTCALPPKRNATLGSGAPMTPVYGQQPQGLKRLLPRVINSLLTTFYPKLTPWELLNQVLHFFWRGVSDAVCIFNRGSDIQILKSEMHQEKALLLFVICCHCCSISGGNGNPSNYAYAN